MLLHSVTDISTISVTLNRKVIKAKLLGERRGAGEGEREGGGERERERERICLLALTKINQGNHYQVACGK